VYYQARKRALKNGHKYHLAAILRRKNRAVKVGINSKKTHPNFKKTYPDGSVSYQRHAEMDAIRFARPGDVIEVMRFRRCDGSLAMAKPCSFCMEHIKNAGIKKVLYTNNEGTWCELQLTS